MTGFNNNFIVLPHGNYGIVNHTENVKTQCWSVIISFKAFKWKKIFIYYVSAAVVSPPRNPLEDVPSLSVIALMRDE